jgi:nicotinate dehydrogenase subunit A
MPRIELQINNTKHRLEIDPERSLLSVLREDLDLTGTKYGCGESQCGACTVLIDGQPTRSCITKANTLENKKITTIEGLAQSGRLHPVQEAFLEVGAMQCGYCIPGMVMSAVGLLNKNSHPNEPEILAAMERNVCRCGTYPRIVSAIRLASTSRKAQRGGGDE